MMHVQADKNRPKLLLFIDSCLYPRLQPTTVKKMTNLMINIDIDAKPEKIVSSLLPLQACASTELQPFDEGTVVV